MKVMLFSEVTTDDLKKIMCIAGLGDCPIRKLEQARSPMSIEGLPLNIPPEMMAEIKVQAEKVGSTFNQILAELEKRKGKAKSG